MNDFWTGVAFIAILFGLIVWVLCRDDWPTEGR